MTLLKILIAIATVLLGLIPALVLAVLLLQPRRVTARSNDRRAG
jgi:hypothetical protein